MQENNSLLVSLQDPLSPVARSARKSLLTVSVLALFVAATELIPKAITPLGIEFDESNRAAFVAILVLVVSYYLAAFILYSIADFLAWRMRALEAVRSSFMQTLKIESAEPPVDERQEFIEEEISRRARKLNFIAKPTILLRGLFEFAVPIVAGGVAVGALIVGP